VEVGYRGECSRAPSVVAGRVTYCYHRDLAYIKGISHDLASPGKALERSDQSKSSSDVFNSYSI
jgi:hypothetical protein